MERLIGDALFAGYVGYNGRAPGGNSMKREDSVEGTEKSKSGGDARHTLVAYFEIVELGSILGVDKETVNLAVRIFRHTANNTSLRNRNVECLAAAAFVAASERRWHDYEVYLRKRKENGCSNGSVPIAEQEVSGKALATREIQDGKLPKIGEGIRPISTRSSDATTLKSNMSSGNSPDRITAGRGHEIQARNENVETGEPNNQVVASLEVEGSEANQDEKAVNKNFKHKNILNDVEAALRNLEETRNIETPPDEISEWPIPPVRLSLEEISSAANLDANEITRYLKVVRMALRKQHPESNSSVSAHIPLFCRRLDLPSRTQRLAVGIAENALQNNICSRRNPVSISVAALYLACQLEGVRRTQTEIYRATNITEVTLRKVHRELSKELKIVTPAWYRSIQNGEKDSTSSEVQKLPDSDGDANLRKREQGDDLVSPEKVLSTQGITLEHNEPGNIEIPLPAPPPLPPGFGDQIPKPAYEKPGFGNQIPKPSNGKETSTNSHAPSSSGMPTKASITKQASPNLPANPLMAMMSNPAMQAFASAFSMMPQLMMPPPPPPLPPSLTAAEGERPPQKSIPEVEKSSTVPQSQLGAEIVTVKNSAFEEERNLVALAADPSRLNQNPLAAMQSVFSANSSLVTPPIPQVNQNIMAGMQSMLGMMQAMHTFQTIQQQQAGATSAESTNVPANPWALMASMVQAQASGSGSAPDFSQGASPAGNAATTRESKRTESEAPNGNSPQDNSSVPQSTSGSGLTLNDNLKAQSKN